jgi:hypothetical protein
VGASDSPQKRVASAVFHLDLAMRRRGRAPSRTFVRHLAPAMRSSAFAVVPQPESVRRGEWSVEMSATSMPSS